MVGGVGVLISINTRASSPSSLLPKAPLPILFTLLPSLIYSRSLFLKRLAGMAVNASGSSIDLIGQPSNAFSPIEDRDWGILTDESL